MPPGALPGAQPQPSPPAFAVAQHAGRAGNDPGMCLEDGDSRGGVLGQVVDGGCGPGAGGTACAPFVAGQNRDPPPRSDGPTRRRRSRWHAGQLVLSRPRARHQGKLPPRPGSRRTAQDHPSPGELDVLGIHPPTVP
jgi:hypothetical protein